MEFRRDRVTWMAYAMLAWFAYLQAAPGLVVPHLRDELDIGYGVGGLHVAAFATGSLVAGLTAGALERAYGRRALLWGSAAMLALGHARADAGARAGGDGRRAARGRLGRRGVADHRAGAARRPPRRAARDRADRGERGRGGRVRRARRRAVAGRGASGAGWRAALLAVVRAAARAVVAEPRARRSTRRRPWRRSRAGRLPAAFRVAVAMLFCTVAAEWCITAWGASFAEDAADVSADTAVALMFGYFGGVVAGRTIGSRLARRYDERRLLAGALALSAAGFALLWPAGSAVTGVRRAGRDRPRARQPVPARARRVRRARAGRARSSRAAAR